MKKITRLNKSLSSGNNAHYRAWKKGKQWLFACTVLAALLTLGTTAFTAKADTTTITNSAQVATTTSSTSVGQAAATSGASETVTSTTSSGTDPSSVSSSHTASSASAATSSPASSSANSQSSQVPTAQSAALTPAVKVAASAPIEDASILSATQSQPNVVTNNSSPADDILTINYSAKVGDVLTVTPALGVVMNLPNLGLIVPGATVSEEYGTTLNSRYLQLTFTKDESVQFDVPITMNLWNDEQLLSDITSATAIPGSYTTFIEATKTDGSIYDTSITTRFSNGSYSTGTSIADIGNFGGGETYLSNKEYTFTLYPTPLINYAADSLDHSKWYSDISAMQLSMPAGFLLDTAASTGWTQPGGSGTDIYFDPLATGAKTNFSGEFTAGAGNYTASGESSMTGYFSYSTTPVTISTTSPFHVSIGDATVSFWPYIESAQVAVKNASNSARNMITSYTYEGDISDDNEPTSDNLVNVKQNYTVADGSKITAISLNTSGSMGLDPAVSVQTIVTYSDGTTEVYMNSVTDANVTIPVKTTASVVSIENTTPVLSAGQDLQTLFTASSLPTFSNGTVIMNGDQMPVTMTASAQGQTVNLTYTASAKAMITYYTNLVNQDFNMFADSNDQYGDISQTKITELFPSAGTDTTTQDIYEPIVYVLLPKGTDYKGITYNKRLTVKPASVKSYKITNGQTVVKLDWTGTNYLLPTNIVPFSIEWQAQSVGQAESSPTAIYVSTVNDPQLTLEANPYGGASLSPLDPTTTSEITQNDPHAVLMGSQSVSITGARILTGSLEITANDGTTGTSAVNDIKNGLNHSLNVVLLNSTSNLYSDGMESLTNLPSSTDGLLLQLTGAGTVVDDNDQPVSSSTAYILYSTQTQTPPAVSADLSLTGYVPANQVTDWSAIRSFIVVAPTMNQNVEYIAQMPVTAPDAATELNNTVTITSTAVQGDLNVFTSSVTDKFISTAVVTTTDTVTKTVHYVDGNGATLAPDYVVTTPTLSKTVDNATGITTYSPDSATLGHQDNPAIKGYEVETSPAEATNDQTVQFGDADLDYTVVYQKLPDSVTTSTVTKTVHYVDGNGATLALDSAASVTLTQSVDQATGAVTLSPNQTLPAMSIPSIKGYDVLSAPAEVTLGQSVGYGSPDLVYTVVYQKEPNVVTTQTVIKTVHYVDGNRTTLAPDYVATVALTQSVDPVTDVATYNPTTGTLGFQTNPLIKGYAIETSPAEATSDQTVQFGDANLDYTVIYKLLPSVVTTDTITKTVHYVDENGNKLAPDYVVTVTLTKSVDPLTDAVTYSPTSSVLGHQANPNLSGYTIAYTPLGATKDQTVQFGAANISYTVVYKKLAKPVEKSENPASPITPTTYSPHTLPDTGDKNDLALSLMGVVTLTSVSFFVVYKKRKNRKA